ncbi:hypothetical protein KC340_g796 [Hortaea werneckii]|nr:hypothetical protein KC342_g541 [Hortaea werneckii]KAI7338888.1 hypothetical protein KC340_g796 [Hortaea werneckii]KAI7375927.1 hypothetical protein KC328_g15148 [Hortaea werneckii]
MQIHQWLMIDAYSRPNGGDMRFYERVAEDIQEFKLKQGLSFEFEVQPLFRSMLMAAFRPSLELYVMFERAVDEGENIIIYRGIRSDSKYAYLGFELVVHAVHVGEELQAYLSDSKDSGILRQERTSMGFNTKHATQDNEKGKQGEQRDKK